MMDANGTMRALWIIDFCDLGPETCVLRTDGINQPG